MAMAAHSVDSKHASSDALSLEDGLPVHAD